MAEYTQQLSDIADKLSTIGQDVASVNTALSSVVGDSGIRVDDATIAGKLDTIVTALGNSGNDTVDYTQTLTQVSKLLVYTDVLLIVLILFVVVGVGCFVGYLLTSRMKLGR